MIDIYPPQEIERLLAEHQVPKDALRPTWEEIVVITRQLGRTVLESCQSQPVNEVYSIMGVLPRGGYFPANLLSRTFGYQSPKLWHLSVSSYLNKGTWAGDTFEYGQMPARHEIEGHNILLVDEVCDRGRTLAETTRLLTNDLGAAAVKSAVLHYKPTQSINNYIPDFYAATTDKWIVYPWEVYEILGEQSLNESLWDADEPHRAVNT